MISKYVTPFFSKDITLSLHMPGHKKKTIPEHFMLSSLHTMPHPKDHDL